MGYAAEDPGANREAYRALRSAIAAGRKPRTMAVYGDSITANGFSTTTNFKNFVTNGYVGWLRFLTRQRFHLPFENNFGVAGETTTQILARLSSVVAAAPDICIVHAGTNDPRSLSSDTDTTIANLAAIYQALYDIGCTVIAIPILARSGANALDANGRKAASKVNDWIRRQGYLRQDFYVADCGLAYDDVSSTTWAEKSGYSDDGIHPNVTGSYYVAQRVADIINTLWPDWRIPCVNQTDLYDATINPEGNLLSNGVMVGGTTSPTSWTLDTSLVGGATATGSKTTLADGRPAAQLDLSGAFTGSNRQASYRASLGTSNFNVGDIVESMMEISIGANSGIAAIRISQQFIEGGVTKGSGDGINAALSLAIPAAGISGVLKTPRYTIGAAPSSALLWAYVDFLSPGSSTAISGVVTLASAESRKVLS